MNPIRSLCLSMVLGWGLALTLAAAPPALPADEGPVVLWKGSAATVLRLRQGKVEREERKGPFRLPLPGMAAAPVRLDPAPPALPPARFPLPDRIVAVSDVHGRFDALLRLLQAQGVVGRDLRWTFGAGHLVVVGDVMDRGAQVMEAYWFLRGLEEPARRAGGRVHVLLGNHEAMVLTGDWRYVNPKYLRVPEGWTPLATQMGPQSELGRWLRSRPVLLQLGPFLFVHGGLSPEFMARGLSLAQINGEVPPVLAEGKRPLPTNVLGTSGPLWYRGLLPEGGAPQSTDEAVQAALDAFEARAFVVGHTTLDRLGAYHGGRVYGIDAGLKDGQPGEAWIWEKGRAWRGRADGSREALAP